MNHIRIKRYNFITFFIIVDLGITIIAQPNSSFSIKSFKNDGDRDFISNFTLLGAAHVANDGEFVSFGSNSPGSSFGSIIYKQPVVFTHPNSSFSTDFTFTIDGNGDGVAFVIFPKIDDLSNVFGEGYFGLLANRNKNVLAVEYDLNGNHVGVDVGSFDSVEISNVSSIRLNLSSGILTSWIDYESRRLQIRLAKSNSEKPKIPLISYPIDLSKMWGDKDVLIAITSSTRANSSQISSLSNWSFVFKANEDGDVIRKKSRFLTVLGGVIFATGCGTILAFFMLFIWVIVYGRHSNVVPELSMNNVDCKYENVNVQVDNVIDDRVVDDNNRSSTS